MPIRDKKTPLFSKKAKKQHAPVSDATTLLGISIDSKRLVTTENYRTTQRLKRKILKKHMILSNTNLILKLTMIVFSLASLIFFSVVSSGGATSNADVRHLIGVGHLTFIWPVIISGVVFIGESLLFVYVYEKRKKISLLYTDSSYGGIKHIKTLTFFSIAMYTMSLLFITIMFGCWFAIIDHSYGDFGKSFQEAFAYSTPAIRDFKDIFIALSVTMIVIEASVISTLIAIYFLNKKYRKELAGMLPHATRTMKRKNFTLK